MKDWREPFRTLELLGGEILFLTEDGEDMLEIRYPDGMVIDVSYIEHWHAYSVAVFPEDTKEGWQHPLEELTVDEKAELPTRIQETVYRHRGK